MRPLLVTRKFRNSNRISFDLSSAVLSGKPALGVFPLSSILNNYCSSHSSVCRFFSSRQPPRKRPEDKRKAMQNKASNSNQIKRKTEPSSFKDTRRKEWNYSLPTSPAKGGEGNPKLAMIQSSDYYYDTQKNKLGEGELVEASRGSSPRLNLPSLNGSALLDPVKFCKQSAQGYQTHNVTRSINGTDAARRLLRGKKDFLTSARKLQTPALLEGHGVPPQLWQHCIDMADALLLHHGEDIVECTFHNYHRGSILPQVLRIRSRDSTNKCCPWPPVGTPIEDWDYHLSLYLTVMERLACHLGMVLHQKSKKNMTFSSSSSQDDNDLDEDDVTSSPLLFPNSTKPHWNVDILRGSYFDLSHKDMGTDVPAMPIVEFAHDSESTGHVLIRVQGLAESNQDFAAATSPSQTPVTLVFDACFRQQSQRSTKSY